ncbi:MAG TPA: FAD binding domain-containing protein [Polyangiaceae bacterium]|jgi:xanthine dehydrogenase YagS FAD-binding subunit
MKTFAWTDPASLGDALALLGPSSIAKAGGVDLMDLLKEHLVAPARLVNLLRVPGLDRIEDRGAQGLRIGPLVTLARIAEDATVAARWRAVAEAAGHAATPQIRNMATIGGNLVQKPRCWYYRLEQFPCLRKGGKECFAREGENAYHAVFANEACCAVHPSSLATPLLALGASVELTSPRGARTVPLENFFVPARELRMRDTLLDADELITAIALPAPAAGSASAYVKQAQKESYDWPLVEVAVAVDRGPTGACTRASVMLGAVAPNPWKARAAEAALVGRPLDEASARDAGKAAVQGATPLRDNGYKLALIEAAVRRAVIAAGEGAR